MTIRKLHYLSGLILTVFIGFHLFNHFYSIFGAQKHIQLMDALRPWYRNVFAETILLIAVGVQIVSGIRLFKLARKQAVSSLKKLHIYTGLYLALFLVVHLSAVFVGRLVLNLDTNFYFGVAGINAFPFNLFFIPYYALAILSFFGHIAAIHQKKMKRTLLSLSLKAQANMFLVVGCC